ncbi:hypothetical protein B0H11DRAFT_699285 [Mycena galericulata]|nr:hypothetical protein B0H11DRAFT_699285 [Mycena galericulata]
MAPSFLLKPVLSLLLLSSFSSTTSFANAPDLYNAHSHALTPRARWGGSGWEGAKTVVGSVTPGPSIADAYWTPEDVWNTGFVNAHSANLAFLSMEKCILFGLCFRDSVRFLFLSVEGKESGERGRGATRLRWCVVRCAEGEGESWARRRCGALEATMGGVPCAGAGSLAGWVGFGVRCAYGRWHGRECGLRD